MTAAESWQRGDWMQTWTGRRFYPLSPRPEELDPADIAHALSLLCRFGGHVDRFYSVAEHCYLMSKAVAPEHALAALLHDATEAYVVDVPRPLKRQLAAYREIEEQVWYAIAYRFGLDFERAELLKQAEPWPSLDELEPLPVVILAWPPAVAERRYLERLAELTAERDA